MKGYGPALLIIGALAVGALVAMQRYDSGFDLTGEKARQDRYNFNQAVQYLEQEEAKRR